METKTTIIITSLNQEDLVNLFSTSIYGSDRFDIVAEDREGVDITDEDCREDIWAKCLLAGKKIVCIDYYAEGEHYGPNENYTFGEEYEECRYTIGLEDIVKGLQKCADGTFKHDNKYGTGDFEWLNECFLHLKDAGYDLDYPQADALLQVILFDELIYG